MYYDKKNFSYKTNCVSGIINYMHVNNYSLYWMKQLENKQKYLSLWFKE